MDRTLRHAEKMACLVGGDGLLQRAGVGQADILAGKADHTAGHIQRVFARFQHARQPVDGRIRVGVAHRLVQRRDQIIMFLALFVIKQGLFGGALLKRLLGHGHAAVRADFAVEHDHLERRKGCARIAVGKHGQRFQNFIRDVHGLTAETARVFQRAAQQRDQFLRRKTVKHKYFTARKQRAVDLERRVFCGRADQNDAAFFDKGEEGVLLRLVEAVNLIDEQDGPLAKTAVVFRLLHDGADLLDAAGHGGKINERGFGTVGDDAGQRRFADPGRAPENHGGYLVRLDQAAQHLAGAQQVCLPYIFVQRGRAQPRRQRLRDPALKQRSLLHIRRLPLRFVYLHYTAPRRRIKQSGGSRGREMRKRVFDFLGLLR